MGLFAGDRGAPVRWLCTSARGAGISILRSLQVHPVVLRSLLISRWCWPCLCCLWACCLFWPPNALCHLPASAAHPGPDPVVFFTVSSLATWRAESIWDAEYLIHRLLTSLPSAADPRGLFRNGTAVLYRDSGGESMYSIVQDGRGLALADLFAALDVDSNGYLERAEMWRLQGFLKYWFTRGSKIAARASALPRDADGRVTLAQVQELWRAELDPAHADFVLVNNSQAPPENADEEAYHRSHAYLNYLPVGMVEAVASQWAVPWIGKPVCPSGSQLFLFLWEMMYMLLATPAIVALGSYLARLCHRCSLRLGGEQPPLDPQGETPRQLCLLAAATCWIFFNPVTYACRVLYVSPDLGKAFAVLMTFSLKDCQRLLAGLEYRIDEREGGEDVSWFDGGVWRDFDALVRCPLCRRLSPVSQTVQKVHGDIRREPCCVCLSADSEVCFACGHLCVCSGCFKSLAEREHQVEDYGANLDMDIQLAETIGAATTSDDEGDNRA